jgi:hypothetical protein
MSGLWKTIVLFALTTAVLWWANDVDVRNEYTAIDALLWLCLPTTLCLLVRAVVETKRGSGRGGDSRAAGG